MNETGAVRWLEWGDAAFTRAQAEQKPILLSIVASWCQCCDEMQRTSYADPAVATFINAEFVPIQVDSDRRPDINERYNLGAWPTTLFLTPSGDILGGGTYVPTDRLAPALAQVAEAFRSRRTEIDRKAAEIARVGAGVGSAPAGSARAEPDSEAFDWLCDQILEEFDEAHGGFQGQQERPPVPALVLALEKYRDDPDERFGRVVSTTLEAMSQGGLYDSVEGGFFRCATGPNWSRPRSEKMLEDNAALLHLYLQAWTVLGDDAYRHRAVDIIRYVQTTLADPLNGAFFGSQAADEAYYRLDTLAERRARPTPRVDQALYVDWNSDMAAAYLRAAELLQDSSLSDFAIRSLERVLLAAYRPGSGVAHWANEGPGVRGLLGDQIHAAGALIWAHAATERLPYSMMAAELVQYAVRTMWDDEGGGFFDRASNEPGCDRHGLLRERLKPFDANCKAATVLARLASITGNGEFRARASQTLGALAHEYRRIGVTGAAYGLAVHEVVHGHAPQGLRLPPVDWRLHELDED